MLSNSAFAQFYTTDTLRYHSFEDKRKRPIEVYKETYAKDSIISYSIKCSSNISNCYVFFDARTKDSLFVKTNSGEWKNIMSSNITPIDLGTFKISSTDHLDTLGSDFWKFKISRTNKNGNSPDYYLFEEGIGIIALDCSFGLFYNSEYEDRNRARVLSR